MLDLVMLREFVDTSLLISRYLQDQSQRVEGGGEGAGVLNKVLYLCGLPPRSNPLRH